MGAAVLFYMTKTPLYSSFIQYNLRFIEYYRDIYAINTSRTNGQFGNGKQWTFELSIYALLFHIELLCILNFEVDLFHGSDLAENSYHIPLTHAVWHHFVLIYSVKVLVLISLASRFVIFVCAPL